MGHGVGVRTADGLGAAGDGDALHPDDGVDAGVGMGEPYDEAGDPEAGEAGPQLATTSVMARVSHAKERFMGESRFVTSLQSLRHIQRRRRDDQGERSLVTKTIARRPDRIGHRTGPAAAQPNRVAWPPEWRRSALPISSLNRQPELANPFEVIPMSIVGPSAMTPAQARTPAQAGSETGSCLHTD